MGHGHGSWVMAVVMGVRVMAVAYTKAVCGLWSRVRVSKEGNGGRSDLDPRPTAVYPSTYPKKTLALTFTLTLTSPTLTIVTIYSLTPLTPIYLSCMLNWTLVNERRHVRYSQSLS